MFDIVGKWLLDVAKYVATALILSRAFLPQEDTFTYWVVSISLFALILFFGLLLVWIGRRLDSVDNNKNKKS